MNRTAFPHALRLPLFVTLSVALHVSAWVALRRGAALRRDPMFDPTPQTLAGDTLDIDPREPAENPPDEAEPDRTPTPARPAQPARPTVPAARSTRATDGAPSGTDGSSESASPTTLFGAVGVRFAADLPTTFTRMFPQAASADPAWNEAAFGSAGTAEVTLVIDDAGHLVSTTVAGAPSRALRQGIDRTLAGLRSRTFTARAATTKLRVSARVQRDDVHDGLHGDVFALSGGSFAGDVGTAFFALPGAGAGRRVDVELRVVP